METLTSNRMRTSTRPRRPKVIFVITSMPIGGAETLLANLVRRLKSSELVPEIVCLKEPGPLGEELAQEVPVYTNLIAHKFDVAVLWRLARLFRDRRCDCVVTVGAGDKMFWGRLAARKAGVPVVLSALHSTGWPDGVGRLNRLLTPLTDGFIAVAAGHARHLREVERFPEAKVITIANGIDTDRFVFCAAARRRIRDTLAIGEEASVIGIVAALRPEKDHMLFLRSARELVGARVDAHFVIVGDGPLRGDLEEEAWRLGLAERVHFLGARSDVPDVLSAVDLFALTSHNEASPVSILEALACGRPVAAPRVGSIAESVQEGLTGRLFEEREPCHIAAVWKSILDLPERGQELGRAGRALVVQHGSLDSMVAGYEQLILQLLAAKHHRPSLGKF